MKNNINLKRLNVAFVIIFLGITFSFLFFAKPSITGHVPAQYSMKDLEVLVIKNQNYVLSSHDLEPMQMKSVLVSGKIVGEGIVKIFLESDGERKLVYSNEPKKGMTSITGLAVSEGGNPTNGIDFVPESKDDFLPEFEEKEQDNYPEEIRVFMELLNKPGEEGKDRKEVMLDFIRSAEGTVFKNQCVETCALFDMKSSKYKFVFETDPGTILLVEEIIYSIEKNEV